MPNQAFMDSAAYYEALTNREQRLEREGPLLKYCLEQAPGRKVLDLACGTGLHAEFLAEAGAEVTAVDLSEGMIAHAQRRRPHPRVTYRLGDMREIDGGPWDLALCLGNSLSLLPNQEDLVTTFRRIYANLTPNGLFLTQTLNYAAESASAPRHRVERTPFEGGELVAVKNLVPCGRRTLLTLTFFDLRGEKATTVSEPALLQNWTYETLLNAAESAGFRVAEVFGGMDRRPYDAEKSPDIVLAGKKLS